MKNIIFDWSGVVKDCVQSQLWIVNRIFEKYGVAPISLEEFRANWEQPPALFYQKYLPKGYIEEERLKMYREVFFDKNGPNTSAFLMVVKLIHKCKSSGSFLAVVSSDSPETLLPEVKEYGLENIFDEIITDANDKLQAVQDLIEKNDLSLENTVFIGDSGHEIDVAKKVGIKSIAVTWGFCSKEKLKSHNPDYLISDIDELGKLVK